MPSNSTSAQTPRFPDGKRIAVTLSFDDGHVLDRRLVELFNKLGLRATWNLNSGALDRPDHVRKNEIVSLYAGHEIAGHSVSHPHLDNLDDENIIAEVGDDLRALEDITGAPVRGFAYPYGNYSPRVIRVLETLDLAYARTCENAHDPFPWEQKLAWPATCFQHARDENGDNVWPQQFRVRYDAGESFCFFVWGHAVEWQDDWTRAEEYFRALSGLDDVWYGTNIELWNHENERRTQLDAASTQ
jgi:peptidoglycan/xylan/chitin deacetylase (PgdA/CDA1 family)